MQCPEDIEQIQVLNFFQARVCFQVICEESQASSSSIIYDNLFEICVY